MNSGLVNEAAEQMYLRVSHNMAFTALDFLAGIDAVCIIASGRFHRLAVDSGRCWLCFRAHVAKPREIILHAREGRKMPGRRHLLATRRGNILDCIPNSAKAVPPPTLDLAQRHEEFNQRSFFIRAISDVTHISSVILGAGGFAARTLRSMPPDPPLVFVDSIESQLAENSRGSFSFGF